MGLDLDAFCRPSTDRKTGLLRETSFAFVFVNRWRRWWAKVKSPSWTGSRTRSIMVEEVIGSISVSLGSSRFGVPRRFWSTVWKYWTTPESDPVLAKKVSIELLCWNSIWVLFFFLLVEAFWSLKLRAIVSCIWNSVIQLGYVYYAVSLVADAWLVFGTSLNCAW